MINKSALKEFEQKMKFFSKKKNISLHEPFFFQDDKKKVIQCIKGGYVSTSGKETKNFEKDLKKFLKCKYVICTINGTSAIHLSYIAAGIKKNNEILIPALNYVASTNAALYIGAIPHFIDLKEETLSIDINKLEKYLNKNSFIKHNKCINKKTNRVIKAIVPTHIFGHCSEIDRLKYLCKRYKLRLIEDASEALGSFYKKKHLGTYGDIGVLSFNGNKIITTGGGGAVITNNKKFAEKVYSLSNISKIPHSFEFLYKEIGFNYRMPSLNASLGRSQLKKINFFLNKKRNNFKFYSKIFLNSKNFRIFCENKFSKSNYWLNSLILNKPNKRLRNMILKKANLNGLKLRPIWKSLDRFNYLKSYPKMDLSNSRKLEMSVINLPSSASLKFEK